MIRASGADSLLVIVPAFNEEGAVGAVSRRQYRATRLNRHAKDLGTLGRIL